MLYEIFLDIDKEIMKIGTREWLEGKISVVENICLTLEDYFHDYEHLKDHNSDRLKILLQNRLAKGYITSLLQKYLKI